MIRRLLALSAVLALALPSAAQVTTEPTQVLLRKSTVAANLRQQAAAQQAQLQQSRAHQGALQSQTGERAISARKAWVAKKKAAQRTAAVSAQRHPAPLPTKVRMARANALLVSKGASRTVRASLLAAVARKSTTSEQAHERQLRAWKAGHAVPAGVSVQEVQRRKAAAAKSSKAASAPSRVAPRVGRSLPAQVPTRSAPKASRQAPKASSRSAPKAAPRAAPAKSPRSAPRTSPSGKGRRG